MDFVICYLQGYKRQGQKDVTVISSSQNIELHVIVITYVLDPY